MDPRGVDALAGDDDGSDATGGRISHGSVDDPWLVDFSANTNPRTPTGTARVYEAALATSRSYPADDYCAFRAAAARYVGCEARQVIPTAGGLAALRLAVSIAILPGDRALVPMPSFGEYAREVRLQGGEPDFRPADEVVELDPSPYAVAFVCQPNNPTGRATDPDRLADFADRCRAADTLLVVDEAFLDFTDLPTMAGRPGVVVARSLTKLFGLPGLRMGFAVATGRYRDRLDTARPAWGLSAPAAAVGTHCLSDRAFIAETRDRVETERDRLVERLSSRFDVIESTAPFLLLDVGSPDAVDDVLVAARDDGIALRDARTFCGLDRHVRLAVRLPSENELLLEALDV
jgi:histidinol-phosphate aminotransferase/threonine-phosphate decarboxylase